MSTIFRTLFLIPLLATTALAASSTSSAVAYDAQITVLRSDATTFVFEYRPAVDSARYVGTSKSFIQYHFPGASLFADSVKAGNPEVLCRRVVLSFPAASGNSVQVTQADYEDLPSTTLAPFPTVKPNNGMLEITGYSLDAQAYSHSGFMPDAPASLGPVQQLRSLLVGTVTLAPVQFDPAARVVRKYTRIVVQVTYGASVVASTNKQDARILGNALLNGMKTSATAVQKMAKISSSTSSVLSSGKWYRIAITDEGIYKIDAAALAAAGITVSSIDPRTIKIYGNGGDDIAESISSSRAVDLVQNAIYVSGESDGSFDTGDYVLFFGRSVRNWKYNTSTKRLEHTLNHYTETNYYWLTYGGDTGKRMSAQASNSSDAQYTPDRFRDGVVVEEENLKPSDVISGKDWYARSLNSASASYTYKLSMPNLVSGDVVRYRYHLLSHSSGASSFTVREGSTTLGKYYFSTDTDEIYMTDNTSTSTLSSSSVSGSNYSQISFTYNYAATSDIGYIDWLEAYFPRYFFAESNYLRFWSPDTTAIVQYQLQDFTAEPMVFNVTQPDSVLYITGLSGSYTFKAQETSSDVQKYIAASSSAWKSPSSITAVDNQDLHGYSTGADLVIITSSDFTDAANELATWRSQSAHGGLSTLVVDVSKIYNEFGGGIPDITAIRDYLKYAYDTWTTPPQFVLFMGGASYDYKGILGSKSSFVPTWQSAESKNEVSSYCTDDFFAKFGGTNVPYLVIGRIPARTSSDAATVVEKIKRYETESVTDGWKLCVLYVGDDSWSGSNEEDGTIHSDQEEALSGSSCTPDEFEKEKIYLAEYPTVYSTLGRRKPDAYAAIINQLNTGVLIFNFSGHANATQLTHEDVFDISTSVPQLTNENRLALFFIAGCNFSQFDDPARYSGGEVVLNKSDGGAIAVIAATRKVYAPPNAYLHQGTYKRMFSHDSHGRLVVDRPATALFNYKVADATSYPINDEDYCFLGDPTMYLQFPSSFAVLDSVNGQRLDSLNGSARTTDVIVKSLGRVTVNGTIRNSDNSVNTSLSGTFLLQMNDASHTVTIKNFYSTVDWSYLATGSVVFRGQGTVTNGHFSSSFLVPKDVSFADSTYSGRLSAYYYNSTTHGQAFSSNIRIAGTDTTTVNDGNGPTVSIYLNSRQFRQGDEVNQHPTLLVDLADSSGINTSVSGIGHRIEGWLNGSSESIDLTGYYTNKTDSYREGTVTYPLADLPSGKNTLVVRAWDSYNNSATAEVFFEVQSDAALSITDVLNYPNPFASSTYFTFRQNRTDALNVKVSIYTVAGRLIQQIEYTTSGEPFVKIPWDGRDRDGDILGNGVYLYKLTANTLDGRYGSNALGKLVVAK